MGDLNDLTSELTLLTWQFVYEKCNSWPFVASHLDGRRVEQCAAVSGNHLFCGSCATRWANLLLFRSIPQQHLLQTMCITWTRQQVHGFPLGVVSLVSGEVKTHCAPNS